MRKSLLIILFLSIAVHFAFFGYPAETVFDEVHFGKFISAYYTGEYYFDIHPPLGKLMIAGFAKTVDFRPEYNFTEIGKEFPDKKYLALRFLPAIAGTLLPVIIYLLIIELGMSRIAAFAGALLIILDNALLTQSRLILLDPFLFLFGFASLLFYFKYSHRFKKQYKQHSNILENVGMLWDWNLFCMAVFAGLAVSIKWTGLSFIALPILIEAYYKLFRDRKFSDFLKFASFSLVSVAIYFSVFVFHFSLLPKSGPGDAFMSASFQKTLEGSRYQNDLNIKPAVLFTKFKELNLEMYNSNQRLGATHPYGSTWNTWPFMTRPIYYWVKDNARIYFFGNPVIWWSSTIAVAIGLWTMAYELWLKFKKGMPPPIVSSPLVTLMIGYWLNLLPFIGIKRVMFLYHYLTALIFAILMLVFFLDKTKNAKRNFGILILSSIIAFLFFSPLNYGLPLSDRAYEFRVWFSSWK